MRVYKEKCRLKYRWWRQRRAYGWRRRHRSAVRDSTAELSRSCGQMDCARAKSTTFARFQCVSAADLRCHSVRQQAQPILARLRWMGSALRILCVLSTYLTLYNKEMLGKHMRKFPAPFLMITVHFTMQAVASRVILWTLVPTSGPGGRE